MLKYLKFVTAPLKGTDNPSGAYLFLPDGPAKPLRTSGSFIAVQGVVMQKVILTSHLRRINNFFIFFLFTAF